ncbi:hypothetical protein [Brunnivagina elsteri]|uniref:Uncharacterized protein n=1 Tax=Brunnivagina elsteri CCALA 953 TaxID=987040 RepID=A0A2A2TMZ9_9CYAN|nr:hypothetical protein [Calothrix elsteri]PAX59795.1 hypothetical protein CK510_05305 [Calothrix elsteri CCALA 953]
MPKKPKGWYKEIVLRPVVHVDGYESYEKICSYVADVYFSRDEEKIKTGMLRNPKESTYITIYTLFKVGQSKCPTYWVSADLLSALMQSNLDVDIENLQWAMKTGLFMLPKGVIISPENRSVDTIFWHYDTDNDLIYWAATDDDAVFCRRFQVFKNLGKYTHVDVKDMNNQTITEFNEYMQSIFLRLILIMQCRPELVDAAEKQDKVTVNQGFGKAQAQDFYQPLWIGQEYRLKREGTVSSDGNKQGGTKSPHWRRGFIRNQPYGEGRQKRKLVWIEPILVMGGE